MKHIISIVIIFFSTLNCFAQNNDYETIAYFTQKNEIELKAKLINLEEDKFLIIIIDNSLLPDESDIIESEISLRIELNAKTNYFNSYYLESINFNKENALFLLDDKTLKLLKENPIKSITIDYKNGTNYTFKNIIKPFFFNN